LRSDGRFEIIGQASRGDEAVAAAKELRPELILIDLRMPGLSGVEAIRRIRDHDRAVPIGALTSLETTESIQAALEAGASRCLFKDSTAADLCEAAAGLARGQREVAAPPQRPSGTASNRVGRLSAREVQVLRQLATEARNPAIARSLGISPATLRTHISTIYRKLDVYDRAQAVLVAIREGLIDVPSR
jgi:two-component system NarL family response regulator